MAVDYDAFTLDEKDNFVKYVLGEKGIEAATRIFLRSYPNPSDNDILEFCFKIAKKKMTDKLRYIKEHKNK